MKVDTLVTLAMREISLTISIHISLNHVTNKINSFNYKAWNRENFVPIQLLNTLCNLVFTSKLNVFGLCPLIYNFELKTGFEGILNPVKIPCSNICWEINMDEAIATIY